jgi:hypothetical protein
VRSPQKLLRVERKARGRRFPGLVPVVRISRPASLPIESSQRPICSNVAHPFDTSPSRAISAAAVSGPRLLAKGLPPGTLTRLSSNVFSAVESDEELVETVRENLAKYEANVGGKANRRQHLERAKVAILRALK